MSKILIRRGVFETNSSSSHSISIADDTKEFVLDNILPDANGNIILTGGDFGWDWFKHNDALTKANYAAVALGESTTLMEVLTEQTGADRIIIAGEGYIDHDSYGTCPTEKEELRNFIFNKNSWLFGGNDNATPDPTFYFVPTYHNDGTVQEVTYTHSLRIEGLDECTKFQGYPTDEEIENGISALLGDVYMRKDGTFDTDHSIENQLRRNTNEMFRFGWSLRSPIDYDDQTCRFDLEGLWNAAQDIYRSDPASETEDWSGVGYKKVRAIEDDLRKKGDKYVRYVKYYVEEL